MSITLDTLQGGGGSITITNPSHPYRPGSAPRQILNRTEGGGWIVSRIGGSNTEEITLSFENYPDSDKSTLETWINDEALGAGQSFTFTDHDGTDHTNMRLIKGIEDWETVAYDGSSPLWRGTLVLSKDLAL